jgi:3-hydroxyisobutyrate dehydrogenase
MQEQVGFIGIGLMGTEMVRRLLAGGVTVRVWNRSPEKLSPLVASGAIEMPSPAALAAASTIVMLCVADTAAVEDVVFRAGGVAEGLRPGAVLVDLSSIRPDATRDMAKRLADSRAAAWVDAPVSGGVKGASEGTLIIMAGGGPADVDRVRPILAAFAQRVTRMGPVGAGQTTKLCNQIIGGCTLATLAETTRLALDAGIDATRLPECLAGGFADSKLLQLFVPRMLERAFEPAVAHVRTILKDLDSARDLGRATGTALPMAGAASELFRLVTAKNGPEIDQTAIFALYDR